MPLSLTVPQDYGYVLLSVASSYLLTFWQGINTSKARKAAGVPYPYLMADKAVAEAEPKANIFNCTQRAHQNTLENYPAVLAMTILSGLVHPRLAAGSAFVWIFGRVAYTLGYSTGKPAGRYHGFVVSTLGQFVLLGATAHASYKLLTA